MRYHVRHTTCYHYPETVTVCHNRVQLQPVEREDQRCLQFDLRLRPEPNLIRSFRDFFGNWIHYFEIHRPHATLEITANSEVLRQPEMLQWPGFSHSWEELGQWIRSPQASLESRRNVFFTLPSPLVGPHPELSRLAWDIFTPGRPVLDAVHHLTRHIHDSFSYAPGATSVTTPLTQVLRQRAGVCQDFAHVAIGVLRSLGLAARYVSGYLETQPPPGGTRLLGTDASHAWFELFLPGSGWFGFDPTNAMVAGQRHIVLAVGRDYADVPPVKGVVTGGREHRLSVAVDVLPLDDPPPAGDGSAWPTDGSSTT
ncbi:MAG: transglutaminase family protein [Magnetococcales bacterium]|nr:transglutaminase family protein [Magnetococcales bacterium]